VHTLLNEMIDKAQQDIFETSNQCMEDIKTLAATSLKNIQGTNARPVPHATTAPQKMHPRFNVDPDYANQMMNAPAKNNIPEYLRSPDQVDTLENKTDAPVEGHTAKPIPFHLCLIHCTPIGRPTRPTILTGCPAYNSTKSLNE
jgi:hypothetical protein